LSIQVKRAVVAKSTLKSWYQKINDENNNVIPVNFGAKKATAVAGAIAA
jgi:hypothetical protein